MAPVIHTLHANRALTGKQTFQSLRVGNVKNREWWVGFKNIPKVTSQLPNVTSDVTARAVTRQHGWCCHRYVKLILGLK